MRDGDMRVGTMRYGIYITTFPFGPNFVFRGNVVVFHFSRSSHFTNIMNQRTVHIFSPYQ